jgi:hypothetical protein
MRLHNNDIFALVNIGLFTLLVGTVYLDRFGHYRGPANLGEFFIYGCAIAILICILWIFLRRVEYPAWLLAMVQVGLLGHFAGAFVAVDGGRLYDTFWLGVGYDKYVHVFNALIATCVLIHLFDRLGVNFAFRWLVVVMVVLGGGAVLEIMEYLVSLIVQNAGVGGYDNNMVDLIANAAGASLGTIAAWAIPYLLQRGRTAAA